MSVTGRLRTMSLPDLLQWAGTNRKTGILSLERAGIRRRIALQEGRIVATAADDPRLLGHCLLSAGHLTPDQIRAAVERHRSTGEPLRALFCAAAGLSEAELRNQVAARAEEVIYSLFEWIDAVFRFDDGAHPDASFLRVERGVDEVLLNGLQRLDEMGMIRKTFRSSGTVLGTTGSPAPPQLVHSGLARRILASVDGRRTIADVLELAQASEFLVLKLLYHLVHTQVLQIAEVRPPAPGATTLLDEATTVESTAALAGVGTTG